MPKYPYRDLGVNFDRNFRNDLNANFDDIEADLRELGAGAQQALEAAEEANTQAIYAQASGDYANDKGDYAAQQGDYAKTQGDYAKAQGDYAKQVADENKTRWLDPVATFDDIATTYPNPQHGDTVQTINDGKVYRYEYGQWKWNQQITDTAIADVQNKIGILNEQLAKKANKYFVSVDEFPRLAPEVVDNPRIQRAIDAAELQKAPLVIPRKDTRYEINAPIYVPSDMVITSDRAEIFLVDGANSRYVIVNKDRINGNKNILISGLIVNGNQTNQNSQSIQGNILGITFESDSDTSACENCIVTNCIILDTAIALRSWCASEGHIPTRMKNKNIMFVNNIMKGCINKIVEILYSDYCLVHGNIVNGCREGFQVIFNANYNIFSNNFIYGAEVSGINITHGSSYNIFHDNYIEGTGTLLIFRNDVYNSVETIRGNKIHNNTFVKVGGGDIFQIGNKLGELTITENEIKGNSFVGMNGTKTGFQMCYFRIYNVSSGDYKITVENFILKDNTFKACTVMPGVANGFVNTTVKEVFIEDNYFYEGSQIQPGKLDELTIERNKGKATDGRPFLNFVSSSNIKRVMLRANRLKKMSLTNWYNTVPVTDVFTVENNTVIDPTTVVCHFSGVAKPILFRGNSIEGLTGTAYVLTFMNVSDLWIKDNRLINCSNGFKRETGDATSTGKVFDNYMEITGTQYYNMPTPAFTFRDNY
jgi:hypothetical protein